MQKQLYAVKWAFSSLYKHFLSLSFTQILTTEQSKQESCTGLVKTEVPPKYCRYGSHACNGDSGNTLEKAGRDQVTFGEQYIITELQKPKKQASYRTPTLICTPLVYIVRRKIIGQRDWARGFSLLVFSCGNALKDAYYWCAEGCSLPSSGKDLQ